jgi:hypothetical protein
VGGMDRFFYNHGKRVASHPFAYIALCLVVTGLCGIGLVKFREENNIIKLWIPEDSSQRFSLFSLNDTRAMPSSDFWLKKNIF